MSKPFDAATKHLLQASPNDWLRLVGIVTDAPVEVIDTDLSTVTTAADGVLRIGSDPPWLVHLEFQASYDRLVGERALKYNVLLRERHSVPVSSNVILLRPEADGTEMNEYVSCDLPNGQRYLEFRYRIIRLWQTPVELVLQGGLGTLPLAPLADLSGTNVGDTIERMRDRIERESTSAEAANLWSTAFVLMGLRFQAEIIQATMKGVQRMRESVTYQLIVDEGRENEAREVVLTLGPRRFGEPSPTIRRRIDRIRSADRLDRLAKSILDVETWDDLLAID